jgi:hypothetical protein
MIEELPDTDDAGAGAIPDSRGDRQATQPHPAAQRAVQGAERETTAQRVQTPGDGTACVECGTILTKGQQDVSRRNYGQLLCPLHQRGAKKVQG